MRPWLPIASVWLLACAAPASSPPPSAPTEITLAPTASASSTPVVPQLPGPPLAGTLAIAINDLGGFVYEAKDQIDVHALEACYQGFLAIPSTRRVGLPGWARFRLTSQANQTAVSVAHVEDSGISAELRGCFGTVLGKAAPLSGATEKHVYLSLR